jgi:tetratricopeptide (TPR) repeat protein
MSSDLESNDRQRQMAQQLFERGNDAALKANFDYAIQMYKDCCKIDPDNLVYRQALRGIERRKFGNDPAKVGRLVGARLQPIRLRAKTAKAKSQWTHVLEVCEEAFTQNPWDVSAARDSAEAAEQLGFVELAQWLLESVQAQANDSEFFRYQAHVHELNQSWQKAIQAWERVKKLAPNDDNANRQINALSAKATIHRAGLNEALDKRAVSAAAEARAAELEDLKQPTLPIDQRLLNQIEEQPEQVGPYLQLADFYRARGKLDEAEKILARGLKAVPKDSVLLTAHAEVQMSRLQRAIEVCTQKCRERPADAEAKAKLERYTTMLTDYEVKEYGRRLALRSHDLELEFQYGLRLAKAGKHDEAITAFQHARSQESLKVQAMLQAGLCFEAIGKLKLAERSFEEALKAADLTDRPTLNELHYRLGRVAENQGNLAAAEEHYNEVAAHDYSYRDVAQRLQNLS